MTLKFAPATLLVTIIGLIFIFPLIVVGFQSELVIYWREPEFGLREISQRFFSAVPDTSVFPWYQKVSRYCSKGRWNCFNNKNFTDFVKYSAFRTEYYSEYFCEHYTDEHGKSNYPWRPYELPCKSFRPQSGNDTKLTTLSLYAEDHLAGQVLRITEADLTNSTTRFNNIPQYFGKVESIAWTGSGNWTIFPQPDFQGLAHCLKGNLSASETASTRYTPPRIYKIKEEVEFDSVGSVLRGCDPMHFDLNWGNALPMFKKTAGKFLQSSLDSFLNTITGGSWLYKGCWFDVEEDEWCA